MGITGNVIKHLQDLWKILSKPEKSTKNWKTKISQCSSTTSSLIPKLTTEPSYLQSFSTESSIALQLSLTYESIGLQTTASQENIEICELDVSENNDSRRKYSNRKES